MSAEDPCCAVDGCAEMSLLRSLAHAENVCELLVAVICAMEEEAVAAEDYYQDSLDQWLEADTARLKESREVRRTTRAQVAQEIEDSGRVYEKVVALTAIERRVFNYATSRAARIARGVEK